MPDRYSIMFLQDNTHFLHGKITFSTIDLVRAYQQIPIRKSDISKTVIITPFGLFEFLYMAFELQNATQTFQIFMDRETTGLDFYFTYILHISMTIWLLLRMKRSTRRI